MKFDQRRALRCFTALLRRRSCRLLHLAAEHDLNTPQMPIEYLLEKPGYLKSSYGFQRLEQLRRRTGSRSIVHRREPSALRIEVFTCAHQHHRLDRPQLGLKTPAKQAGLPDRQQQSKRLLHGVPDPSEESPHIFLGFAYV